MPDETRSRQVIDELVGRLPAGQVLTDPDATGRFAHDQAEWAPFGTPAAVVRPHTAEQIQQVVLACLRHGVPVVPRGAGTGLSGGANAIDGCVILSTEAMTAVKEINPLERLAVVEPG